MNAQYDYLVIGGGSGGVASARRAAEYGARVALIEPGRLGGTCVNVGCVPKKVMWNAAGIAQALRDAPDYGFAAPTVGLAWSTLRARREAYVARLNGIYADLLERAAVTLIRGHARFVGARTVEVDGTRHAAAHVLVATGSRSVRPQLPGAELGMDSDGFFALAHQPRRVAVVGAGYIAVELAGVLRTLGSAVDLFIRGRQVLRSFDALIAEAVTGHLVSEGVTLVTDFTPAGAQQLPDGYSLSTADGRSFGGYDALLWAVGRLPNTAGLDLAAADVGCTADGAIAVDAYQNTTAAGVYAVGDVTGRAPLTPVAIAAGRRLADRLFGAQPQRRLDYELIPSVVFGHPPVGSVGLSEAQARETHGAAAVKVYTTRFTDMYYALGEHRPATCAKLVCVGPQERVVGCHVVGRGADEMIQGFAVALRIGACKRDLDDTVAIHPTAAEELVLMR